MTEEDWIKYALNAAAKNDETALTLFGKMAYEYDSVKLKLRDLGFGVTGMGLRETVDELLDRIVEKEWKKLKCSCHSFLPCPKHGMNRVL